MMYTHCELRLTGDPVIIAEFLKDHGIPGTPWSFCTVAPVGAMDDETLLAAWGCSGLPEPIGTVPFLAAPIGARLRFRCAGGPPLRWLDKLAHRYPALAIYFTHATEATAVYGGVSYSDGIKRTNEVEGDPQGTDREVDYLLL